MREIHVRRKDPGGRCAGLESALNIGRMYPVSLPLHLFPANQSDFTKRTCRSCDYVHLEVILAPYNPRES
jgi:hypothetical protein